jgi:carboxypeptidase C (cathepsin A)
MRSLIGSTAIALSLVSAPLTAQDGRGSDKPEKATPAPAPAVEPVVSITRHSGTFGGQRIGYTATASDTFLKDDKGNPRARIFSVSYIKDAPEANRPVTFLFNGGPGSGSLWLHMGAFGPKRVAIPNDGRDDGAPPYRIIDNPDSLLDVTDIVFIDPVGTAFSTALGNTDPKEFWGVTKDAKSIAEFIRLWLSQNSRWNAPKYLGGESYGTTRTAAVVNELEGTYNDVAFNGLLLISTILDFGAQAEVPGNEMPYVLMVPSMAVTALYHGKTTPAAAGGSPADLAAEAKVFATNEYLPALMKGSALVGAERAAIRAKLARYTGLTEQYLENADLRVTPGRFYKELLRDRGLVVGRLDARYTGKDFDSAGEEPDNDPSFYGIDASYTAAFNAYVRQELKFNPERQYVTIGGVRDWDWDLPGGENRYYKNVAPYIGKALRENSGLRVLVAQGWYDFATPFFGAEYSLTRTGIPTDRIEYTNYDAGHMMYVNETDLTKLSRDIRGFIRRR